MSRTSKDRPAQQPTSQVGGQVDGRTGSTLAPGKRTRSQGQSSAASLALAPDPGSAPVQRSASPGVSDLPVRAVHEWTHDPNVLAAHGHPQGAVWRQSSAAGAIEAGHAAHVLDGVAAGSAGRPLEPGVRADMEASFGQSLADVQVHTDCAAGEAARALNANAFTTGRHVYFDQGKYAPQSEPGKHLLAHELAHVVQQSDLAARGSGAGPTVSQPGDSAELAADRAADAVVRGQRVSDVGRAPACVLHRDAIGDLSSTSEGNWLGNVDEDEALSRLRALSPAERQSLATDASHHALLDRLCDAFDAGEMLQMFSVIPFDLRWRLYWLSKAGVIDELNLEQWRYVFAYAPPDQVAALRNYPDGYRLFLQHAPDNMVPAWDRLQGLENGTWSGNAQEIRNAVNALSADQRQTVVADNAKMRLIITRCGNTADKFRVITYLDPALKWAVYWLDQGGALADLTDQQWSQLLAEAPRSEYDELVGWAEMWQLAQQHCPASILQITRQNSDAATAAGALSDPVQVQTLFSSLGPAGFLATATQGPAPVVQANYGNVKTANLVHPVLDGLPRGPRMGAQAVENLKKWFEQGGETDVPTLEKMVSVRFALATSGAGSMPHTSGSNPANLQPWTADGLRRAWTVMERLPPEQVEGNTRLLHMLRDANQSNGNAYFWGDDVVMGYQSDAELTAGTPGDQRVYAAGGQGPGSAAVPVNQFNATLRHEIGHAVDAQLGIMNTWGRQNVAGGWTKYGSYSEFVDAIIAADGGMNGHGYPDAGLYRRAMIHAVSNDVDFTAAVTAVGGDATAAAAFQNKGPVRAVWTTGNWTGGGSGPWYTDAWVTVGGRNFQRAYDNSASLYSFLAAERTARMVTEYQWRAPGEWFAEVYQVYYAEQETGADVPVGGILRSRDAAAADMMSNLVDRGHSPQDMRGGRTQRAPGT